MPAWPSGFLRITKSTVDSLHVASGGWGGRLGRPNEKSPARGNVAGLCGEADDA